MTPELNPEQGEYQMAVKISTSGKNEAKSESETLPNEEETAVPAGEEVIYPDGTLQLPREGGVFIANEDGTTTKQD
jgi:hypothetical protein